MVETSDASMVATDRAHLVETRTLRSAHSSISLARMVLPNRWFEAVAGRAVGHRVYCSQGLELPM